MLTAIARWFGIAEPGDVIVNFNWDTLASDALYHFSRLWFPLTGFGWSVGIILKYPSDSIDGESYVSLLLHRHGCVSLYSSFTRGHGAAPRLGRAA